MPENSPSNFPLYFQPFHFLSIIFRTLQRITPCISLWSINFGKHRRSTRTIGDQVDEKRRRSVSGRFNRVPSLIDIQPIVMRAELLGIRVSIVNTSIGGWDNT